MRRLVALALGAFMLHLNAQRADIACAQHDGNASSSMQAAQSPTHIMHGAAMHDVASAGPATASETEDCETPVQPACCQAVVSCSIALGLDDVRRSSDPAASHDVIALVGQTRPASRITAPEPPPPKA